MAQVNILNFKSLKWWIFWIHKWGHQWPKWGGNISDFADGDFHLFGSLGEAFIFYFSLAHKKNTQHVQHALKFSRKNPLPFLETRRGAPGWSRAKWSKIIAPLLKFERWDCCIDTSVWARLHQSSATRAGTSSGLGNIRPGLEKMQFTLLPSCPTQLICIFITFGIEKT